LDGVRLVQLPPVRTIGTDFKTLLDEAGTPVDPERLEERRALLLDTLQASDRTFSSPNSSPSAAAAWRANSCRCSKPPAPSNPALWWPARCATFW
jgi:hypothetical protein